MQPKETKILDATNHSLVYGTGRSVIKIALVADGYVSAIAMEIHALRALACGGTWHLERWVCARYKISKKTLRERKKTFLVIREGEVVTNDYCLR